MTLHFNGSDRSYLWNSICMLSLMRSEAPILWFSHCVKSSLVSRRNKVECSMWARLTSSRQVAA